MKNQHSTNDPNAPYATKGRSVFETPCRYAGKPKVRKTCSTLPTTYSATSEVVIPMYSTPGEALLTITLTKSPVCDATYSRGQTNGVYTCWNRWNHDHGWDSSRRISGKDVYTSWSRSWSLQ